MLLFVKQQQMSRATSFFMHPLILLAVFRNGLDPIASSRWTFQDETKGYQQATCLQQVHFGKCMATASLNWLPGCVVWNISTRRCLESSTASQKNLGAWHSEFSTFQGALVRWIRGHQSLRWKSPLQCWKPCPNRQRQPIQFPCGHLGIWAEFARGSYFMSFHVDI